MGSCPVFFAILGERKTNVSWSHIYIMKIKDNMVCAIFIKRYLKSVRIINKLYIDFYNKM